MMDNLKILSKKEVKPILKNLKDRFNFKKGLDYTILKNNQNKLFLINSQLKDIALDNLKINSIGMYFGDFSDGIRLSIEGSQMIGNDCTKNILELDDKNSKYWLTGLDLDIEYENKGFVLIKYADEFLGCGKAVTDKILNYVPKNRRLKK